MPTNAATLNQLMADAQYSKESLSQVIKVLKQEVGGRFEAGVDGLQIFRGSVTALAAGGEIRTNGGVRIYAIHVESPAAATQDVYVRVFNTSTGGIALTTTGWTACLEAIGLKCAATKSKTAVFLPSGTEFALAASYAVVDAATLNTAAVAGSAPNVTILYTNA
jgi:hypothetical protein